MIKKIAVISLYGILFFIAVELFTGCPALAPNNNPGSSSSSRILDFSSNTNAWTIMVYMDGNNNLAPDALVNFNEMEAGLTNTNIYVVVLFALSPNYGMPWSGARLYHVNYDPNGLDSNIRSTRLVGTINGIYLSQNNYTNLDMADPKTLSSFVDFSKSQFPASNYMLILWDHGGGWRNDIEGEISSRPGIKNTLMKISHTSGQAHTEKDISLPGGRQSVKKTGGFRDIIEDDLSGNVMYNSQVRQALAGKGITVIGFDACLMNMLEVCYEFKNTAQYLVGSVEEEPAAGWDYQAFLRLFLASPMNTTDLCSAAVNAYSNRYVSTTGTSMSAVDLTKIDLLMGSFSNYVVDLEANLVNPAHDISVFSNQSNNFLNNIQEYDTGNAGNLGADINIDLWDLSDKIPYGSTAGLKAAVKNAVISEWHNSGGTIFTGDPNSHGIALYFGTYQGRSGDLFYDYSYIFSNTYAIQFLNYSPYPQYLLDFYNYPADDLWLSNNQVISNSIGSNADQYYEIYIISNGTFTVDMLSGSNCDDDLYLCDLNSIDQIDPVAESSNNGYGVSQHITYNTTNTGWYLVDVYRKSVQTITDTNNDFSLVVSNGTAVLK